MVKCIQEKDTEEGRVISVPTRKPTILYCDMWLMILKEKNFA